ncbi:MAG: AMP-binding protein [Actinomycetota bacterium]|nr:AMP-binding protein [Actinomycetota bacterium]MDG2120773.1 AMP-binding protein [Actinomycetota bacterium]
MKGHPDLQSLGPNLPIEQWTLVNAVQMQAKSYGEKEFLSFENGEALTFAALDQLTDQLASGLQELGLRPGDRLLGLMTNSRDFILLMIAVHKRRAIFVPINTELKSSFLQHQVENSEPLIVAVDEDLLNRFNEIDLPSLGIKQILITGKEQKSGSNSDLSYDIPTTNIETLINSPINSNAIASPTPEDVCTIMYTSGTTGPAKGVLMPQGHCYLFALGTVAAMELTEDDRYFCCMPLFHANGLFMQVYASLLAGCSAYVAKHFSVKSWLDTVIDQEATVTNALGVMPEFIFRSSPSPRDHLHKLTRIMAIPVAEEWGKAMEERFGVVLRQGFGMTEVNMVAYSDPDDPVMAGCAGPPLSDFFEVMIADPETDTEVAVDAIGEILVRPKKPFCFNLGYFKMPDKTVEAWRNLWFHTGDAGKIDSEGRLFFVDRINDRIRRRGENISSYELEQALNQHPEVAESAVIGLKVEGAGGEDEVKAVVAILGSQPDPVTFLDWCTPRMPRHAVPRYIEFVTELDKTASGKVRKQAMRDAGVTDSTWDRESVGYRIARD